MGSLDALWGLSVTILAGILLGLMETAYTAHLRVARFRRGVNDATDVLLCAVGTLVVAAGIAVADWGQLRLWSVVGMVIGFGVYHALGRPLLLWSLAAFERGLCRLTGWLSRPFRQAGGALFQFARRRAHDRRPRV